MDFINTTELLAICRDKNIPISQAMIEREISETGVSREDVLARMAHSWDIMKSAARKSVETDIKTNGGLIGGQAKLLDKHMSSGHSLVSGLLGGAIKYSMGTLEVNASMGLVVAAPTAGSCGVIPGMMLSLQEQFGMTDEQIIKGLFNTAAIGYLAMRNATVAGAEGGCQAEIGVASAMAASAVVELMGGTPEQCTDAASTVLMNMLGLVCDPVGGLVEYPCQNRNAAGVANAITAAEMSLAGITQIISLDEMLETMYDVGKHLPEDLRETARGGCAICKSAQACIK